MGTVFCACTKNGAKARVNIFISLFMLLSFVSIKSTILGNKVISNLHFFSRRSWSIHDDHFIEIEVTLISVI